MAAYNVNIDSQAIILLDEYLKNVKSKNIKLVLVYTPEYREAADFIKNKQYLLSVFQSCAKKYDFPFLDYSGDTLCDNKKYFFNALHLNQIGATVFSSHFAHDIKQLDLLDKKSCNP